MLKIMNFLVKLDAILTKFKFGRSAAGRPPEQRMARGALSILRLLACFSASSKTTSSRRTKEI